MVRDNPLEGSYWLIVMASSNLVLAEHYRKCAGIGAICIEFDGSVTMYDTVGLEVPAGVIVLCFNSGDASQIAGLLQTCRGDQATVAAGLVKSAQQIWIGLTPHAIVVERALATVEAVSTTMERLQAAGELKEINRAFKAARLDNPSLRYGDYLRTRKAIMLQAIARQV